MNKLLKIGHNIFAIGMSALGILCFVDKDFIIGRPPAWSPSFSINPAFAYISGAIVILCGFAISLNKKAAAAAFTIGLMILLLSFSRRIPQFMNDWANAYKALALAGGAFIVAASFLNPAQKKTATFLTGFGLVTLSSFFIVCGYAHFKFSGFVNDLIPAFIPFHSFFTYFAAICLFAGGVGILLPFTRKWAAMLSGIMIAGWFLLLHIPRFLADPENVSDRLGVCESFTFVGIFFVLSALSSPLKVAPATDPVPNN